MKKMTIAKTGIYEGYKYAIVEHNDMGHRCGYVRILPKHKLYQKSYSSMVTIPTNFNIKNEKIGKRGPITLLCLDLKLNDTSIALDLLFDVHGGLTFSGKFPKLGKGWWIGFDCMHAGDARDVTIMNENAKRFYSKYTLSLPDDVVRTEEYVKNECKRLINQIKKYFDK